METIMILDWRKWILKKVNFCKKLRFLFFEVLDDKQQNSQAINGFLKTLENKNVLSPPGHIDL